MDNKDKLLQRKAFYNSATNEEADLKKRIFVDPIFGFPSCPDAGKNEG